jgi:hypothetical protein
MRIQELQDLSYHKLFGAAMNNIVSQNVQHRARAGGAVVNDFTWSHTPEGHVFWQHVNIGNFDEALDMMPELRDGAAEAPILTINVGLWR